MMTFHSNGEDIPYKRNYLTAPGIIVKRRLLKTGEKTPFQLSVIKMVVADAFGVPVENIDSKSRFREEFVEPRQCFMYFAKWHTDFPLKKIGTLCGGRDHSTVIHGATTWGDIVGQSKRLTLIQDEVSKRLAGMSDEMAKSMKSEEPQTLAA